MGRHLDWRFLYPLLNRSPQTELEFLLGGVTWRSEAERLQCHDHVSAAFASAAERSLSAGWRRAAIIGRNCALVERLYQQHRGFSFGDITALTLPFGHDGVFTDEDMAMITTLYTSHANRWPLPALISLTQPLVASLLGSGQIEALLAVRRHLLTLSIPLDMFDHMRYKTGWTAFIVDYKLHNLRSHNGPALLHYLDGLVAFRQHPDVPAAVVTIFDAAVASSELTTELLARRAAGETAEQLAKEPAGRDPEYHFQRALKAALDAM
jgi:hypothetical protein